MAEVYQFLKILHNKTCVSSMFSPLQYLVTNSLSNDKIEFISSNESASLYSQAQQQKWRVKADGCHTEQGPSWRCPAVSWVPNTVNNSIIFFIALKRAKPIFFFLFKEIVNLYSLAHNLRSGKAKISPTITGDSSNKQTSEIALNYQQHSLTVI